MSEVRARIIKSTELGARLLASSISDSPEDSPDSGHEAPACGVVTEVVGLAVRARLDAQELGIGDFVAIDTRVEGGSTDARIPAQVVGFKAGQALLVPMSDTRGISLASRVYPRARAAAMQCGQHLLGRILDGLGQPLDGGPPVPASGELWPIARPAPNPLTCPAIDQPLPTGIRAIDGLLTLGRGQRVGLFAGPGVGKSSLLGRIASAAPVDVCVVCLVGERGRDVRAFANQRLSADSRRRTVLVCAASDAPSQVRARAPFLATAIAEWFCERRGAHVLLLIDSLTRLARAQREVGLAVGEVPVRHGYPPSVFARLPQLVERAGPRRSGSITALYSVLTDSERADDPIAVEVRSLVDGHIALSRQRANRGMWPAIDVLGSVSRAMAQVATPAHRRAAERIRRQLAVYAEHEPLLDMGAYRSGQNPEADAAITARSSIDAFLCHEQPVAYQTAIEQLLELTSDASDRTGPR